MFKSFYRTLLMILRMFRNAMLRPFRMLYAQFRRATNLTRQASKVVPKLAKSVTKVKVRPTHRADYLDAGPVYIAKSLLVLILVGIVAVVLLFVFIIWPWMEAKWFTAHMYMEEEKAETYTGRVVLYYDPEKTLPWYEGRLKEGLKQGKGKLFYENGIPLYIGPFAEDLYEGTGKTQDEKGNAVYDGGFVKGLYSGKGKLYEEGVMLYEGAFLEGAYHGQGKLYTKGELLYEGMFTFGKYHGQGKLYDTGQLIYEGDFADGKRDGDGVAYEKENKRYAGEFAKDAYQGMGTLFYPNGQKELESMDFAAGAVEGRATAWYENGEKKYEGQMSGGNYNGEGTLYHDNGMKWYGGSFLGGGFDGQGTLFKEDGSQLYKGGFSANVYEGLGRLTLAPGKHIEGTFAQGVTEGDVRLFINDLLYYEGAMENETMHGAGKRFSLDGRVIFAGQFQKGMIDADSLIGMPVDALRAEVFREALMEEYQNDLGFVIQNMDLGIAIFCNLGINEEEIVVHRVFLYGQERQDPLGTGEFSVPEGYAAEQKNRREVPMLIKGVPLAEEGVTRTNTRYIYEGINYTLRLWEDGEGGVPLLEWRSYRLLPDDSDGGGEEDEEGKAIDKLLGELGLTEAYDEALEEAKEEGAEEGEEGAEGEPEASASPTVSAKPT